MNASVSGKGPGKKRNCQLFKEVPPQWIE